MPHSPSFHSLGAVSVVPLTVRLEIDTPSELMRTIALVPQLSGLPTVGVGVLRVIVSPLPSSFIGVEIVI